MILIANSIGAYFSMCALTQEIIVKAYFISHIVNIENGGGVTLGVMFIVMSVLCRYGAELNADQAGKEIES